MSGAAPRRLLVRSVNWLGDAVMTAPALDRITEALPETEITLLTLESLAALWRTHPGMAKVLTFRKDEPWWKVSRRLRAERFDAALILPNSPRTALEAWAAGIPRRIGAATAWRTLFLTDRLPLRSQVIAKRRPADIVKWASQPGAPAMPKPAGGDAAHHAWHYVRLAGALGGRQILESPRLHLAKTECRTLVDAFLESTGGPRPPRPWLGVNAGAAYGPAKQWPLDRFAAVARAALRHGAGAAWVFGGPGERPAGEALAASIGPGAHCAAGRTDLRTLMAMLASCDALVTNDSGPMHLAAALGTPVAALFGSTSPELTGPGRPGGDGHAIIASGAGCSPCFLRRCPIDGRCQTGITVDETVVAVLRLLDPQRR
jgi:heptosyltransferase II